MAVYFEGPFYDGVMWPVEPGIAPDPAPAPDPVEPPNVILRGAKGSELTHAELDSNFTQISTAVVEAKEQYRTVRNGLLIHQENHGLAVLDVISLYGTKWETMDGMLPDTSGPILVLEVLNDDEFVIGSPGFCKVPNHGILGNTHHYLDFLVDGSIGISTYPNWEGQQPYLYALTKDDLIVYQQELYPPLVDDDLLVMDITAIDNWQDSLPETYVGGIWESIQYGVNGQDVQALMFASSYESIIRAAKLVRVEFDSPTGTPVNVSVGNDGYFEIQDYESNGIIAIPQNMAELIVTSQMPFSISKIEIAYYNELERLV